MRWHLYARGAVLLATAVLANVAGCLVVTPLDELPSETGGSSHAGSAGTGQGGNKPTSGNGGVNDAGDAPSAGEAGATSVGECQTNAQCVARAADEPARCRPSDHVCVPLKNDACPIVVGSFENANAVYFGAFASLDRTTPGDNAVIWAHELAIKELSGDNVGGLPDGPGGPDGTRRPLVMIVCNNLPATIDPAMKHLADEIQVPAVIATLKPGNLRSSFERYQKTRDIFYLSPVAVTTPIVIEPDDGHIWNLLGQPSDLAPTYVELLELAEAHWIDRYKITDPLRVALIKTEDAYDSELDDALQSKLRFNGKSVAANDTDFKDFTIPETPDFVALAKQIITFSPDIVISSASEAFIMNGGLQDELEADWETQAKGKRPPFYILSPFNAGDLKDFVGRLSGKLERAPGVEEQERYVGVSIASAVDNTLQNSYEIRLSSIAPDPVNDTANYYDAVYYLAYAMYGANQPDGITGSGIAAGMMRLLDGDDVNIGPTAISSTFKTLSDKKKTVHLVSTLGPPDFDRTTGERPVDGSVFCFKRTGNTAKPVFDTLRYDKAKNALVGDSLPCISGFYP